MSKDLDNKYFIIINRDEIIFTCLNNENKISYTKKHNLINSPHNPFGELEKFFINNLIDIEKNLKDSIKEIFIIMDIDNSLNVDLSIRYKTKMEKINDNRINDLLNYLKYEFNKYSADQKIIHMKISKLLIDGKENNLSFVEEVFNDLILEVKFQCLKKQTIEIIKKLFSNYQISVEKILLVNHLKQSINNQTDNIVYSVNKFLNGESSNEVLWVSKKTIKQGFFERLFNFFS